MSDEHEAVHRVDLFVGGVDKRKQIGRRDALLLGTAAWQ
jgi:hypothetical protein